MYPSPGSSTLRCLLAGIVGLLLFSGLADGQRTPLETLVDEIVQEEAPTEAEKKAEKKPADPDRPAGKWSPEDEKKMVEAGFRKLPSGNYYRQRADGTKVVLRPDGTREYLLRDGTRITVGPDGTSLVRRPPDYAQVQVPPPAARVPEKRQPRPAPPPPRNDEPAPTPPPFQIEPREPRDDRKHADWRELDEFIRKRGNSRFPWLGNEDPAKLKQPGAGNPADDIRSDVDLPGGPRIITRAGGVKQTVFPDGTEVIRYPGSDRLTVRDPEGKTWQATPGKDGTYRFRFGGTTVDLDPKNDGMRLTYEDGTKKLLRDDGSAVNDGKGGIEVRDPRGDLNYSEYRNPITNYKIVQERDQAWVYDGEGNLVGKGKIVDGRMVYEDIVSGRPIAIDEIARPGTNPRTYLGRLLGQNGRSPKGSIPPPRGNIFDRMREALKKGLKDGSIDIPPERLKLAETLARLKDKKPPDELDKVRDKLVKPFLRMATLEEEQRALEKRRPALEKERAALQAEEKALAKRQAEVESLRSKFGDALALDNEQSALTMLKTLLDFREKTIKNLEKALQAEARKAVGKVDFGKYDLCPNGLKWKECGGDHNPIKERWLRDQLTRILGPGFAAREKLLLRNQDDYQVKKRDYDRRKKALAKKLEDRKNGNADYEKAERQLRIDQVRFRERQRETAKQWEEDRRRSAAIAGELQRLRSYLKDLLPETP